MTEQILNGHVSTNRLYSAIHVGIRWKIRTEDKSQTDITETKSARCFNETHVITVRQMVVEQC